MGFFFWASGKATYQSLFWCPMPRDSDQLTVVVVVPVGLLDGVAVGHGVRGWRRRQVGRHAAHGHRLAVSVYRVRVEGAELRVLGDGRALEGVPVQVVPGVAGDAGRVGDGPDGHLRWDVRVDVLVELGVEVRPLQEGVRHAGRAAQPLVLVVVAGGAGSAAGPLADDDEEQHQDEDAEHEDHDADDLLEADVPGGGHHPVGGRHVELALLPAETRRAAAVVGAVGVVTPAAVAAGFCGTLVHVSLAPGQKTAAEFDRRRPQGTASRCDTRLETSYTFQNSTLT